MRLRVVVAAVGCLGLLAACSGDSSDDTEPTNTPAATATGSAATPTSQAETPAAAETPTATATPSPTTGPENTPTATATSPAPTAPAATATPGGGSPATQVVVQPTPTPKPTGNPMSATIGAGSRANVWVPANVAIAPGGTVRWSWSGTLPHNVVGSNFAFGPTNVSTADTVSHTFPSAGTYQFICEVHPDTMRGTVTVQ